MGFLIGQPCATHFVGTVPSQISQQLAISPLPIIKHLTVIKHSGSATFAEPQSSMLQGTESKIPDVSNDSPDVEMEASNGLPHVLSGLDTKAISQRPKPHMSHAPHQPQPTWHSPSITAIST
jgi:hypothetical protein